MINTTIHIGSALLEGSYVGGEALNRIYLGSTLLYSVQTKLSTPTNVSVEGTTASWDKVENATSYDLLADGGLFANVQA